jgi:prepilin peptidase dependent protein B
MGENHQPGRHRGDALSVQRQVTAGFAPELSVTLAARSAADGLAREVEQRVTGYNL